jgi:23S rRNA (guanosine2251-2'-O)-methyltransferase
MSSQIEGRNPVLEALRSGRALNRIIISNDISRHSSISEILHLAKEKRVPVDYVPIEAIKQKSVTKAHQGIIAFGASKEFVSIDDLFLASSNKNEPPLYFMLDGLEDPHNLGAIIRTADASGVHGIIIPERRAVGLTETVAKSSAGAIEYVPVVRVINLNYTIKDLKENDIYVIGVDQDGKKRFREVDYNRPVTIVIGGEGGGISRLVKENCDEIISIPMKGKISSLNASVAAGVIMYEIMRQRETRSA